MPRFTEIELTSQTEGLWTWRAAGARQPRGTVAAELVPEGVRVGDIVRAEIESGIDGIEVVAIATPGVVRERAERGQRIELLGPSSRIRSGVSVVLAGGGRRQRREGEGESRRPAPKRERRERTPEGSRRPGERARRARLGEQGAEPSRGPAGEGASRGARGAGEAGAANRLPRRPGGTRARQPVVSTTYRNAALAALRPEQLPIAEQLLRGGLPAVRAAIDEQNAEARRAGRPPIAAEPLIAMAEELLPMINLASWKDRATTAQAAGRETRLRELRSIVAASRTVVLDEEGRSLAKALQEALDQRVSALREEWVRRINAALDAGKVLEALEISGRPPEPGTRCPAELAVRLATDAGAAMSAEVEPQRWLALLQAVLASPVRRSVKPAGVPNAPETLQAARQHAGSVPELAKLLGLRIPPPPPRRPAPGRALIAAGGGGSTGGS